MSNTKVFVADALSGDATVEAAESFGDRLAIKVIPGGLPSVGRNAGAKFADTRYVLFLDADIELADPSLLRRALALMKRKSLHCVTTDIMCRDGRLFDDLLYVLNNTAQRGSRLFKPFATGMFMLVEKARFEALGGFDERALYAEDYQLTRQIERARFRVIRGGIYSTNRRFLKMGRKAIFALFMRTAFHSRKPDFFRSELHRAYWEAY
jgi:glycosyltransferase involved in cell wall biosynthesis